MTYYHDVVTERSFRELSALKNITPFLLIGGWAVYLYTQALKSKDIDVIVAFDALAPLAKAYDLMKNDRLKKYEARKGPVQIDVYLPRYSQLGIPAEILQRHARTAGGFSVLHPDYLTALKLHTLRERARTAKGEKDFLDVVSLMRSGSVDMPAVVAILKEHALAKALTTFVTLLGERRDVPELSLNAHAYGRFRKSVLEKIVGGG